ncbi:MAG: hypothetical protein JWL62_3794 [Hyphomicrobiales bacterium]|nr:hypothetical protein [Hyphomicrobiales bacterium]
MFVTTLLNPKAAFLGMTLSPTVSLVPLVISGVGCALVAGTFWLVLGSAAGRLGRGPMSRKPALA